MTTKSKARKYAVLVITLVLLMVCGVLAFFYFKNINKEETPVVFDYERSDNTRAITNSLYDYQNAKTRVLVKSDTDDFESYGGDVQLIEDGVFLVSFRTEEDAQKLLEDQTVVSMQDGAIEFQSADRKADYEDGYVEGEPSIETELADFIYSQSVMEKDVKVAVLDTGYAKNVVSEEDANRVLEGKNFSATGGESTEDDNGHGTDVSAMIINDTFSNVSILPIKVLDSTGHGTLSALYEGIKYAIEQEVDIINISLSTASTNTILIEEAIKEAEEKGIIVVAAAGNYEDNVKNYCPANIDSVITVAALDGNMNPVKYSNYGEKVDYAGICDEYFQGTSFTAAKVTALVALLKGTSIDYDLESIQETLDKYAIRIEGKEKYVGAGVLTLQSVRADGSICDVAYPDIETAENWKDLSGEQLDKLFFYSSEYKNAVFWQHLTEEEKQEVYAKSAGYVRKIVTHYEGDEVEEIPLTKYWESFDLDNTSAEEYLNRDGYCHIQTLRGGSVFAKIKVSVTRGNTSSGSTSASVTVDRNDYLAVSGHNYMCDDMNHDGYYDEWCGGYSYNINSSYYNFSHLATTSEATQGYTAGGWFNTHNHSNGCGNGTFSVAGPEGLGMKSTAFSNPNAVWGHMTASIYYNPWQHTVAFNANGGSGAPGSQVKTWGAPLQLSSTKPTRAYYNFVNWKTSSGSQYDPGGWYGSDQNGGTVTLYAQWSPYKHTLHFDANGGSGAPGDVTKTYGQALTFPSTKPTRPGYAFKGWSTSSNSDLRINQGVTKLYPNNSYIKRVWMCQVNATTWEVLVKADGVDSVSLPTWSTDGGQDDIVWHPTGSGSWVRDGYSYNFGTQISLHNLDMGSYMTHVYASSGGVLKESSQSIFREYNLCWQPGDNYNPDYNGGTKTFYANWEASSTVVKFDANGGSDASWINCELWPGTSSNCLRGVITRPNYEFAGWTRTRNGIDYVFDKNGYWVDDPTYWKADGGSYNGIPTATWQRDDLKGQTITLYAKWVPKVYHITLDKQGGTGGSCDKYYHIYSTLNTTRVADNPYAYNLDDNTGIATLNYKYTGGGQQFTVPYSTAYTLTVAGAQGGSKYGTGGKGGTSSGKVTLGKEDVLKIYVGNQPTGTNAGYNGGANGYTYDPARGVQSGGGGATDIRKDGTSLDNRIIVAGGGGGGSIYQNTSVHGGSGGGLEAGPAEYIGCINGIDTAKTTGWTKSTGATQTGSFKYSEESYRSNMTSSVAGIQNFYNTTNANSGTYAGWFGAYLAGKGSGARNGAGGGYYGGAAYWGNWFVAGGFGGSGYIGGVTNGSMTTGTNSGNGWAKISFRAKDAANHNRNNYVGKPTKTGYIFKGYYTGANGTGTQVVDENGYIVDANNSFTANTTVYAYWKPITYSVAYSTGDTPYVSGTNPDSQYVKYDEVFNLRAYNHKGLVGMPYKITFNGNKPAGASTNIPYLQPAISGNSEFSHYTGSDGKTYTNAQSVSKLMTVQSSVIGMTCQWNSKTVTPTKPTLPGYTFLGWATSATGAVNSNYNSFDIVPSTSAFNLALYAKWQPNNYTITFNYNKPSVITTGTMSGNSTTTKTVTFDKAVGNLPTPTLGTSGSVQFVGWFDANGNQWTANTVYKTVGNTTLTARWKYLIEFNANKPSSASSSITGTTASAWAEYGKTYNLTTNGFALTGYTFGGWNTKSDGTGTNYGNGAQISNLLTNANGRFILYGKWTANSYKLSYNLNKPSNATYTPANGSGNPSTAVYDKEITINNPSLTGFTFTGWTISGYNTNTAVVDGSRYSATSWTSEKRTKFKNLTPVKDATVSFTANWSVNQYKIAYNLNKPSNASSDPVFGTNHPTSANFESTVTIDNPSLKGWTFKGWTVTGYNTNTAVVNGSKYSNATLTGTKATSFKNLNPTHGATVTFTAVWEANTYTVVIKPGRPTSPKSVYDVTVMSTPSGWTYDSTNKYFKKTFTYDSTTIGLTSDKFYKLTGYTPTGSFYTGQNTNGTGNGTTFTSASKNLTSVKDATVTLYSGWVDNPPVIRVLTDDEMYASTWKKFSPVLAHKAKLFNNDMVLMEITDLGSGLSDWGSWEYEVNSWNGNDSSYFEIPQQKFELALPGNPEINNLTDYSRMYNGISCDGFIDQNKKFARVVTDWVQTEIDYNDPTSTKASYSPSHKKIGSCWRYKDSTTNGQWKETGEWTNLPTPTREGFTFNGWVESSVWTNQLKPNANYETLAPTAVNGIKGKYTPKVGKKFYASWMRNKYSVTYNYTLNGGTSFSDASGNVKQYYYNADRGLPTSYDVKLSYTATKNGDTGVYSSSNLDGWQFMRWHTSNSNDQKQALTSFSMPAKDVTLYALFKKHLVATFHQHEKVNADANTVLRTTKHETDVWNRTNTATLKENTLKQIYDWTNLGWTTQTAPKSTVTNNFTIWQDTTYYAQYRRWQTIRCTNLSTEKTFEDWQYRNSYAINNLTGIDYTVPAQQVYKNWKSIGWAEKPAADASIVRLSGKQYHDTFDKQFWARYEKDVVVDYTSTGGLTTPPTQIGKANYNAARFVKYPVFKVAPAIEKYSAKFVEWNSDRLGAGTSYIPNTSYKFMFSTTLHARWETIDVKEIKLDKSSAVIVVGETIKVTPTVLPLNASNGNVVYSVSDPSIVEIGANAEIIGKKSGTTKLTVQSVSNPEVYAECTITVCSASVSIPKLVVANSPFEVTVSSTSSQKTASLKCSYISNLTGKTTGKTYGMELYKKVANGYTKQYLDKENEAENTIVSSNSKTPGKATLVFRTKESENSMVNDVYDGSATFKLELK